MTARIVSAFAVLCTIQVKAQPAPTAAGEVSCTIQIERLRLNSNHSDYSPFLHAGKLYFVSDRISEVGVQYTDNKNNSAINDLYVSDTRGENRFSTPQKLPKPINTITHEGPLSADTNGNFYYSTGAGPNGEQQIFVCNGMDTKKPKVQPLSLTADTVPCLHPAVSPSGDTIVFSSKTSQSGMDLFMAIRQPDGAWKTVATLPAAVNTTANEVFPFLTGSRLFFSSNREGGRGGLDLYYIDLHDPLSQPVALPEPLNSPADDFGIWTDSGFTSGYVSSNREARYKDDIYAFRTTIPDFRSASTPTVRFNFCYTFYEETTMLAEDTAEMAYEWDFGDGAKSRGLKVRHCYPGPGIYSISLNVVEKVSGEVFQSKVNYELDIPEPEKLQIHCADTVYTGEPIQINATGSAIAGRTIQKMYWSFGDGWYNSGTEVAHVYQTAGIVQLELWVIAINTFSGAQEKFKVSKTITVNTKSG